MRAATSYSIPTPRKISGKADNLTVTVCESRERERVERERERRSANGNGNERERERFVVHRISAESVSDRTIPRLAEAVTFLPWPTFYSVMVL